MSEKQYLAILLAVYSARIVPKWMLWVASIACLAASLFGCAPEWSGEPDAVPVTEVHVVSNVEWNNLKCSYTATLPAVELHCLGDAPPERVKTYVTCGDDPRVCYWRDMSVWRCPVVVANERFNR